jgi:hypothetical protein
MLFRIRKCPVYPCNILDYLVVCAYISKITSYIQYICHKWIFPATLTSTKNSLLAMLPTILSFSHLLKNAKEMGHLKLWNWHEQEKYMHNFCFVLHFILQYTLTRSCVLLPNRLPTTPSRGSGWAPGRLSTQAVPGPSSLAGSQLCPQDLTELWTKFYHH